LWVQRSRDFAAGKMKYALAAAAIVAGIAFVATRPAPVAPASPGIALPSLKLDYQLRTP
jgi:hypothetical protein